MAAKRVSTAKRPASTRDDDDLKDLDLDKEMDRLADAVDQVARKIEKPTVTPVDICKGIRANFERKKKAWEDAGKPSKGPVFAAYVAATILVQTWCTG